MLTKNHRQEALSLAYVQAVAARAGMSCSFRNFDYGIDITVHDIWQRGRRYGETGFKIDFQAKSTVAAALTAGVLQYDLDIKNYEDLRVAPSTCPRLLVVLALPDEEVQWIEQTEEYLLVRRAAYWIALMGRDPVSNTRQVRVALPRENLFTIEALQNLMKRVRNGETL